MSVRSVMVVGLVALSGMVGSGVSPSQALRQQNELLFRQLKEARGLTDAQISAIRNIFEKSGYIGQGNPELTRHAVTPEQCQAKLKQKGLQYENARFEKICGGKYLAPLYDPATQKPEDAKVCIDQFEFPNIPCAYPVVWVKAREAAEICWAAGERLADAHEWEGACEGSLKPPDYHFDQLRGLSPDAAVNRMRAAHNREYSASKRWSYGPEYRKGVCATSGAKTAGCTGGSWTGCGSNTFPAGDFPECHSPLDVYDLNGNAAEHMNLPLNESQMSSLGSRELGYTEMKGSWFIFDTFRAHEDWCRWRAPFWHGSRVMDEHSHANYHLGFRCVKDLK
jgi:formylglycine-generating enzyme required for sulfatase activity